MTTRRGRASSWLGAHRKSILRGLVLFLCVLGVSAVALTLLMAVPPHLLTWDGGFAFSMGALEQMRGSGAVAFGALVILVQAALTVLLCAIPGASMAMIVGVALMYKDEKWLAFVLCLLAVLCSSTIMFLIGKWGGKKAIDWIAGEGSTDKAMAIIKEKGTVYFPAAILLPGFPDDALCMAAGAIKMNPWFYSISVVVCKAIGVATLVWGTSVMPGKGSSLYDWFLFITACLVWVIIGLRICRWIDAKLTKRLKDKKSKIEGENK